MSTSSTPSTSTSAPATPPISFVDLKTGVNKVPDTFFL
jgi:hypothetical protein